MRLGAACFVLLATASCASHPAAEWLGSDHAPDTGNSGYCRSTTCTPPADYPTSDGSCEPPDWADSKECLEKKKASNAPLWWRSSCIGYDLHRGSSRRVSYDQFAAAAHAAFAAWIATDCYSPGASNGSRVSVDVRDLGPVSCDHAAYDREGGPNQNVIVFHDDGWPYEARDRAATGTPKSLTLALTTVTFEPQTGEIYDADIELNSADYTIVPTDGGADGPDAADLQTILTHEAGHLFGLAHSPASDAVMFASADNGGGTRKRALTLNDVHGICAIYPSDRTRNVSALVDPSGKVAAGACDPTPRHGFSASCN